jgi:hypothetical protein
LLRVPTSLQQHLDQGDDRRRQMDVRVLRGAEQVSVVGRRRSCEDLSSRQRRGDHALDGEPHPDRFTLGVFGISIERCLRGSLARHRRRRRGDLRGREQRRVVA